MDELKCIKAAVKGDDQAFYKLMKNHGSQLYRIALSYFNNEDEALEAIQEVTYRAYKNIGKVRNVEYFQTWIIRILLNYCNDELKRRKRILPLTHHPGEREETNPVDPARRLQVLEALHQLNPNYKKVILLRYFEDFSIKEISAIMGRPEGTIKTWLHRALEVLRKYLEKEGGLYV